MPMTHAEVMSLLSQSIKPDPFREKALGLAIDIQKERLRRNLTQEELCEVLSHSFISVTQPELSEIECVLESERLLPLAIRIRQQLLGKDVSDEEL